MRLPPLGKHPASEALSLNFAIQSFCPVATRASASGATSSTLAPCGSCACTRSAISLRTASGAATAHVAASASASAPALGKRIEELHEAVDLLRIEDAMAAEGGHDRARIGHRRIRDHGADRGLAERAHPRAFEPGAEIRR